MSYRIEQEQTYLGQQRWQWGTWIDAPDSDLDRISKVTWLLHHTFPQPVIESIDRQRRFKIVLNGWGMFQIRADLELIEGGPVKLSHWLKLAYPDENSAPTRGAPVKEAPPERPIPIPQGKYVFLSYGSADAKLADRVKAEMQGRGFEVKDAAEVKAGEPFEAAIQKMIRESDMVLGLVNSDFASPNVIMELNSAEQSAKPTLAVMGRGVQEVFGLSKSLKRLRLDLDEPGSGMELADRLIKESLEPGGS